MSKQAKQVKENFPAYDLRHKEQIVDFAIRSVEEVVEMFGDYTETAHSHNYHTVLWSQNYSGRHIIDYKEYEMRPNDIFFVGPGQVHQVDHTDNPKGIVILFSCDFLNKNYINDEFIYNLNLFSEIGSSPPIQISPDSAFLLKELVYKIRQILATNDPHKFDKIGAYLKLFLLECSPYSHPPLTKNNDQFLQTGGDLIKNFKLLIESHFSTWHKVGEYAKELNVSSDYLNNVVKSSMNKTAKELIQQRLVLEAKRMGLHTELTSKEIAFQIGFQESSHFSRFFKKEENISFTQFRQSLTNS